MSKFSSIRTQPFLFNYSQKKCILEQTNPVLVTLVQGSINIVSMSEIDFLAVSAILMIISDFYWHWLLNGPPVVNTTMVAAFAFLPSNFFSIIEFVVKLIGSHKENSDPSSSRAT